MASLNRIIILLDGHGEELFSGESMLSSPPPELDDRAQGADDDEPCPETLRSSVLVLVPDADARHRGAA